ncbi:MAG: lysostaphin resistance A-like protein [Rhodanobacteraceae bacterium]
MDQHTETPSPGNANVPDDGAPPVCGASSRHPGVWSGLGTVVLYFLLQLGISFAAGTLLALALKLRIGVGAGVLHVLGAMDLLRTNPDARAILAVVTIVVAAIVMVVVVRRLWPEQWSRGELPGFGFTRPANPLAYVGAVALAVILLVASGPLTEMLAGKHPVQQNIDVMADQVSLAMRVPLAILVVCVAPVIEELVFRGVLLSGLASRMRVGWAVLLSALIFGCAHLPDFQFAWYPVPALVLLGLALGWLRVYTHSLWPSITLHATNNFIAMLAWFIAAGGH